MSTKIYNGIKYKTNNLHELLKMFKKKREQAEKICIKNFLDRELRFFISMNNLEEKEPFNIFMEISKSASKDERTIKDFNYTLSFIVFPHKSGDLYGYYLNDNISEYQKIVKSVSTDFHYQNQVDKPKAISVKKWNERRDIWEELLPGIGRLDDHGFIFKLVKDDVFWNNQTEIEKRIELVLPDLIKRKDKVKKAMKVIGAVNLNKELLNLYECDRFGYWDIVENKIQVCIGMRKLPIYIDANYKDYQKESERITKELIEHRKNFEV